MEVDEGAYLVRLARKAVTIYLRDGKYVEPDDKPFLKERKGVFVSIYTYPVKELRGCIGFPLPQYSLGEATVRAAVGAAVEDPRFQPITRSELGKIVFEVSVLTPPTPIEVRDRKNLPMLIKIGEDGLVIETRHTAGLLLPQVPVEFGWNAEEFLSHLCLKAGLDPTYWLYGDMRLYRFGAEVFAEKEPGGEVFRVQLMKC